MKDDDGDVGLSEAGIDAILAVALRQLGAPPDPWRLPRKAIVDFEGRTWKVREYPSEDEAVGQEACLRLAAPAVPSPRLIARRNAYLVFAWPELDRPRKKGADLAEGIGDALAALNGIACPETSARSLLEEAARWLDRLVDQRILSRKARGWVWSGLMQRLPPSPRISLDYLDAMPHNFGVLDGRLILLDEKHLRPAFTGAGLVKPQAILPARQARVLREAYDRRAGTAGPGNPDDFLDVYYFIHALHFYAQRMEEGLAHLPAVARCRRYRRWLVARVSPSTFDGWAENVRFIAAYPVDALRFGLSKVRFVLAGGARSEAAAESTSP
jgi:hypothetical protein